MPSYGMHIRTIFRSTSRVEKLPSASDIAIGRKILPMRSQQPTLLPSVPSERSTPSSRSGVETETCLPAGELLPERLVAVGESPDSTDRCVRWVRAASWSALIWACALPNSRKMTARKRLTTKKPAIITISTK